MDDELLLSKVCVYTGCSRCITPAVTLNYCGRVYDCMNHFLHCNRNSSTNDRCECAHLVQYNVLLNH